CAVSIAVAAATARAETPASNRWPCLRQPRTAPRAVPALPALPALLPAAAWFTAPPGSVASRGAVVRSSGRRDRPDRCRFVRAVRDVSENGRVTRGGLVRRAPRGQASDEVPLAEDEEE